MHRFSLRLTIAALALAIVAAAAAADDAPVPPGAVPVKVWATHYYLLNAKPAARGVPLRNIRNRVIGPRLRRRTWCNAALQGSVHVSSTTYSYFGQRYPRQTRCRSRASETVRWAKSKHRYGTGSKGNPLVPFRTIACDMGTVRRSKRWAGGGYARFGQQVFIPSAKGTRLPDGTVHDGIFTCADVGQRITGNHIDVFIGDANGARDALARDPFAFVGHSPAKTVKAYLLPME